MRFKSESFIYLPLSAMGPDRGFADMVNYLRWEEELGHKDAVGD